MEIWSWLTGHLSDAYLMGLANTIKSQYFVVAMLAVPFVWPPLRWLIRQYAKATPWTDDDKVADDLDSKINQIFDKRMGLPEAKEDEE